MSWTVNNPTSVGGATKKSDYDKLWDNCDFFKIDHNTDGTHEKLTVGSDADGDIYYRASSVLARLAKGAANTKLFMNAGATAPEWAAGIKTIAFTRDMQAATGNVAYTGAGFKPVAIIIVAGIDGEVSIGWSESSASARGCIQIAPAAHQGNFRTFVVYVADGGGQFQDAIMSSWDSDGITLAWVYSGAHAAGTMNGQILFFR